MVVFPSRPTLRADSLTDKLSATANARLFIMITMCDMLMIVMMAFIPYHHHQIRNMLSRGLPLEDCEVMGNVEVEDSDVIGNAGEQNCRTNLPLGPQSSFW